MSSKYRKELENPTGKDNDTNFLHISGWSNNPKKLDTGKPRHDLISPRFTDELARCLQYGAEKYAEDTNSLPNYLKGDGLEYSRLIGALKRHLNKFEQGIDQDMENPNFPMYHIVQVAVNAMMLTDYVLTNKGIDDRLTLERISKGK